MKTLRPVNQKSIYHSYGELYEKIMNEECDVAKAEVAAHCLDGMNRTYALEIKRAEVENMLKGNSEKIEIRIVEVKNFDNIPLDEANKHNEQL
jgi:hypothetical protein